jgi:hypothetical protein
MRKKVQQDHDKWLVSMGVKLGKPKQPKQGIYDIPDYKKDLRTLPPLSNNVDNGYAKKANTYSGSDNLIVGQAYNKGNYVVLSKAEAADPATGKRR